MTRDDILRMAEESGLAEVLSKYDSEYGHDNSKETEGFSELKRFAALVAAAEREACALVCDAKAIIEGAVIEGGTAQRCAAAIRARGEA